MKIYKLLVLCLTLTSVFAIPKRRKYQRVGKPFPTSRFRLPNSTRPVFYQLHMRTFLYHDDFDFEGNMKIQIVAQEVTNTVTLHAKDLTISKINFLTKTNAMVEENLRFTYMKPYELEYFRVTLPKLVKKDDTFVLEFVYNGTFNPDGVGLYRSYVWDKTIGDSFDNFTIHYVASQFQPTNARYAFPCYDEPEIRAQFAISVEHSVHFTAFSNTDIVHTNPAGLLPLINNTITSFETTPKLPTYAVVLIVAPFKAIFNDGTKVRQRIITHFTKISNHEGDFALKQFGPILATMEDEIGIQYSLLHKLDHVAVDPYNYDGMDFFGLNIYSEDILLVDKNSKDTVAAEARKFCIQMIARTVANQFFGCLISPHWWTDVWLKEAFARFYEYYISDLEYPQHRFMELFREEQLKPLFDHDILREAFSLPLSNYVEDPAGIVFNTHNEMAKSKGGVVLRMFQTAFGFDAFRKGLRLYLQRRSFQSATPDDLFAIFQEVVDQDLPMFQLNVKSVMGSWIYKAGYPLISVSVTGNTLTLEQHRYPTAAGEVYSVPLTFATRKKPDFSIQPAQLWLKAEKMDVPLDYVFATESDWIIFNIQQTGYYRISYTPRMWFLIADVLREDYEIVHRINREVLIAELYLGYFELEELSISDVFQVLSYLNHEDRNEVWAEADQILHPIQYNFVGTDIYKSFLKFLQYTTRTELKKIGFVAMDGESLNDALLREFLVDYNCFGLDRLCYDHFFGQLKLLLAGHTLDVVVNFCVVFNNITTPAYDHFVKIINNDETFPARMPVLYGLTCTVNKEQFVMLIKLLEDRSNVLTDEERVNALASMLFISNEAQNEAIEYINKHPRMLTHEKVRYVLKKSINSRKAYDRVQEILKASKNYLTTQDFFALQEGLRERRLWHEHHYNPAQTWFQVNGHIE